MLAQGRIRNAAEKAWGATRRATDALILSRTGEEPELTGETSDGLLHLDAEDQEVRRVRLLARYFTRQGHLHDRCFYHGRCDPIDETERRVRETSDYIEDAERLAQEKSHEKADRPGSRGPDIGPGADCGSHPGGAG